jgi:hypothetical protein
MIAQTVAARRPAAALRSVPARMADFLTHRSASTDGVTEADLLVDFTKEEIATHLEEAKKIARNAGKVRQ